MIYKLLPGCYHGRRLKRLYYDGGCGSDDDDDDDDDVAK